VISLNALDVLGSTDHSRAADHRTNGAPPAARIVSYHFRKMRAMTAAYFTELNKGYNLLSSNLKNVLVSKAIPMLHFLLSYGFKLSQLTC
jgi:hypothetical protein